MRKSRSGRRLTIQHGLKIVSFAALGFAFGPYIPLLVGLVLCSFIGSYAGKLALITTECVLTNWWRPWHAGATNAPTNTPVPPTNMVTMVVITPTTKNLILPVEALRNLGAQVEAKMKSAITICSKYFGSATTT